MGPSPEGHRGIAGAPATGPDPPGCRGMLHEGGRQRSRVSRRQYSGAAAPSPCQGPRGAPTISGRRGGVS